MVADGMPMINWNSDRRGLSNNRRALLLTVDDSILRLLKRLIVAFLCFKLNSRVKLESSRLLAETETACDCYTIMLMAFEQLNSSKLNLSLSHLIAFGLTFYKTVFSPNAVYPKRPLNPVNRFRSHKNKEHIEADWNANGLIWLSWLFSEPFRSI